MVITIKVKKKEMTSKTRITEQIIFNKAQKKSFFLCLSVVVIYSQADNICRLKG